jgi:uncharacterized SAM-binding protein YcdF (DUF218 family)
MVRWGLTAGIGILAAWLTVVVVPGFLLYATMPIEADAVVLFGGGDQDARQRLVEEVTARGIAKFVIIPAQGQVFETQVADRLINPDKTTAIAAGILKRHHRSDVEATHIEMLQAEALMDYIGADTANLVSAPYHMRRLEIVAGRVFEPEAYRLAFVPTIHAPPHWPWFLSLADWRWVLSEYIHILWFVFYEPFF